MMRSPALFMRCIFDQSPILEIAKTFSHSKRWAYHILKKYDTEGNSKTVHQRGRKRKTTEEQDGELLDHVLKNRRTSQCKVAILMQNKENFPKLSRRTVGNRLKEAGIKNQLAIVDELTETHKQKRVDWCLEHQAYLQVQPDYFEKTVISDEAKFCLGPGRIGIYVFPGEKRHDAALQVKNLANRKSGIMVFGVIAANGEKLLITVPGKITAIVYRDILKEKVLPFLEKIEKDYRYQQDNAPVHTAKIVKEFLMEQSVLTMHWPAKSPDLSVIENVWALMKQWLSKLLNPPKNLKELQEKIYEAWEVVVTPELCRELFASIPRRLADCIHKGARINY